MARCIFLLLFIASIPSAFAERWIVKNPRAQLIQTVSIRNFQIGYDHYAVVNAPQFSARLGFLSENSEETFLDLPVETPELIPTAPGPYRDGWHVEKLRYKDLPAQPDGNGIVVAVMDTGVDYRHASLQGNYWKNKGEIPNNGRDDDRNGYVDDFLGYDFAEPDADPIDDWGHGTVCAGVIMADRHQASGAVGLARGVQIMPIRVYGDFGKKTFLSDVAAGVVYAVDNGAHILNNSWRISADGSLGEISNGSLGLLRDAIQYAGDRGVIFVGIAGNERRNLDDPGSVMSYPAGFVGLWNLVIVASTDADDQISVFSSYGRKYVTIAAPGENIMTTRKPYGWESYNGTSMAAPIVSAALARAMSGSLSGRAAIDRMIETSRQNPALEKKVKAGVIDLVKFLGRDRGN